jgi:hypothetical protein
MIPPILALPILLSAGFIGVERLVLLRLATQSLEWPRTRARIVAATNNIAFFQDPVARFTADLAYEYRIGDHSYTGTKVRFGGYLFRHTARRVAYHYQAGSSVQVAYNPARPEQAVLEPGAILTDYIVLCGCLAWIVVGVYVGFLQHAS